MALLIYEILAQVLILSRFQWTLKHWCHCAFVRVLMATRAVHYDVCLFIITDRAARWTIYSVDTRLE